VAWQVPSRRPGFAGPAARGRRASSAPSCRQASATAGAHRKPPPCCPLAAAAAHTAANAAGGASRAAGTPLVAVPKPAAPGSRMARNGLPRPRRETVVMRDRSGAPAIVASRCGMVPAAPRGRPETLWGPTVGADAPAPLMRTAPLASPMLQRSSDAAPGASSSGAGIVQRSSACPVPLGAPAPAASRHRSQPCTVGNIYSTHFWSRPGVPTTTRAQAWRT